MSNPEICFLTATELTRLLRARDLSARAVLEAHLAQIEQVNPQVNAIITLLPEQAMDQARVVDEALARGQAVGPLHGLLIAYKYRLDEILLLHQCHRSARHLGTLWFYAGRLARGRPDRGAAPGRLGRLATGRCDLATVVRLINLH